MKLENILATEIHRMFLKKANSSREKEQRERKKELLVIIIF